MKFHINKLVLWLKDDQVRELVFLPNKVNVVTGDSSTGKSTILRIIDYCFCKSSKPLKISQEIINENTLWYGINFTINDKNYTIARGRIVDNIPSTEYFFSSIGELPLKPEINISEPELKKIIEAEFSIDSNLVIPYGGKILKAGSKISFRYFMLYNTQSNNVIINEDQFFDKVNEARYKEALDRIFGLSLGSTSPEAVLISEEIVKVKKQQLSIERKEELFSKQRNVFQSNVQGLISSAQNIGLIDSGLPTISEGVSILNDLVQNYMSSYRKEGMEEINTLQRSRRDIIRRIKNIESFERNYEEYIKLISNNADSLQPINTLKGNFSDIILAPSVAIIFESLEKKLSKLKSELKNKKPFSANLTSEKDALIIQLNEIEEKINLYPSKSPDFVEEAHRLILLGEIKAKLELYTQVVEEIDFSKQLSDIQEELDQLQNRLKLLNDTKELALNLLQDHIQKYIDASDALGIYQKYKAYFNEKDKILQLRSPESIVTADVGSSSNHLFLHLCLFLGLHDYLIQRKSRYVPQYIILDQLSRPYYEEVKKKNPKIQNDDQIDDKLLESDDRKKLREAFLLLDNFITEIIDKRKDTFQFIILEHVSPEFFDEIGMKHFNLVANFRNGDALIPVTETSV